MVVKQVVIVCAGEWSIFSYGTMFYMYVLLFKWFNIFSARKQIYYAGFSDEIVT